MYKKGLNKDEFKGKMRYFWTKHWSYFTIKTWVNKIFKTMSNKLGVALTKELCPVCTKEMDGDILLNTRLTEGEAKKVEAMHGQVVGWSKTLCPDCLDMKSKGFILIGAVEAKTEDVTNPYRSGNIWVVKQEVADELFKPNPAPPAGIAFIDVTVAAQMQLPEVNLNA